MCSLRRAIELNPELADSWRALADHLHAADDPEAADEAYSRYLRASTKDPRLLEPGRRFARTGSRWPRRFCAST